MQKILMLSLLNGNWDDIIAWRKKTEQLDIGLVRKKINTLYPIGLMNIAAYANEKVKADFLIFDLNIAAHEYLLKPDHEKGSFENFLEYCLEEIISLGFKSISVVALSALFNENYSSIAPTLKFFRKKFPDCVQVMGGHLASACHKDLLFGCPELDAICYGEGEIPFSLLMDELNKDVKTFFKENDSWVTRDKPEQFVPKNMLVENLDDIPPYALDMVYKSAEYSVLTQNTFSLGCEEISDARDISMFSSRGCNFRCIFCASQAIHGHKVRRYSINRVKSDILLYNRKYGLNSFPFLDDHFLSDKKSALEIMNFIKANNFYSRTNNLPYIYINEEIVKAFKETGTDRIAIALDGVNEAFLRKFVKKPANFHKAAKSIQILQGNGIEVLCNVIIGFPGETKAMIEEGVKSIKRLGANWYSIYIATPLVGSELYEICLNKGYISKKDNIFAASYFTSIIETKDFSSDWIQNKAYEINLRLNFVENFDMRSHNYTIALKLFERIFMYVIREHAFAYYFAAVCAKKLGMAKKYASYKQMYNQIVSRSAYWRAWADYFSLPSELGAECEK